MRKLFKYFGSVKKEMIIMPFLILTEALFEILIPVYLSQLIDNGIENPNGTDMAYILNRGMYMIIFAIIALVLGVIVTRLSAKISTEFGHNLRQAQYEKIQEYSFENIDNFKTSSLITRMTMDVNMIQMSANMILRIGFRAPALIIFSIVTISLTAGKLALTFVVTTPILIFGFYFIMKKAHQYFMQMFERIDDLNLTIQEDLIGVRTVKSYVREDYESDRFKNATLNVREVAIKAEKVIIFNSPLMQFAIGLSFVLIGFFGSRMFVLSGLSKGEFSQTITYINQVLFSLMMISQVFLMIVMSRASVNRINEVLEEVPLLNEVSNPIKEVNDGSFEFKDVSFKYGGLNDNYVLENIDLKVDSGSFIGIFGSTGTGKSTLVQLLSRLYDVTDGEILVGGKDIKKYELETLRKEVNIVLQKNVLFSGTIRDNIKWGKNDATDEEIIEALKKSQAYEFVSKMDKGLDTWIEQGGVNVSGGQRQRLTIARALISNPKILILDDSTSAVDTKTDARIKRSLNEENPMMTKVVISQRLSSIEDADKIVIMDNKGIAALGNHEELYKSNKMYKEIYDTQQQSREVEQ